MRQKLKAFNQWMKATRHMQGDDLWKRIKSKLAGHYRYYGITDNMGALTSYLYFVKRYVFKWLNRRSQRKSYSWKEFVRLWNLSDMPPLKIYVSIYDL